MSKSDELEKVRIWTVNDEPYWNGVVRSGGHAPGCGKLHRARIEDGQVVEVDCHGTAESWVAFSSDSAPQHDRDTCSNCGRLTEVPGVERGEYVSRVNLTEKYAPDEWSPTPLASSEPKPEGSENE